MIAYLRGVLVEKEADHVVLEAGGVGYEALINAATAARLPVQGAEAELYTAESVGMYGGGATLYAFATREDKRMFLAFKGLRATGAKKALEYLEKASKSPPDFKRAIIDGDAGLLTSLFGFTRKTADRLINGLRDKLGARAVGQERVIRDSPAHASGNPLSRALDALTALGYKPLECRSALESVRRDLSGRPADVEEILRLALRRL